MSQEKLQITDMQKFWGVIEVYYGIVQVVNKHCFLFLMRLTMVPRENKNNAYSKCGWTNKEYCGIFCFGQFGINKHLQFFSKTTNCCDSLLLFVFEKKLLRLFIPNCTRKIM